MIAPADPRSMLDAGHRARALDDLASGLVVDVLVIGGGITGAGVALDAASRGLSVALVEQGDLAAGTSRRSSKLVHGGLRYLASGQVAIAAESTRERGILASTMAPHLIRPLPFVTPLGEAGVGRLVGVAASSAQHGADVLRRASRTSAALFPAPRRIQADEVRGLVPGVRGAGLRGGLVHWDGQLEDDARLVLAVARTAAAHGAMIVTRCAALDAGAGGATLLDLHSGSVLDVRARHVVNATGVWADRLDPAVRLRPSRGTHVVLPSSALGNPVAAMAMPVPGHLARMLFALPQPEGIVILGLTDEPAEGALPDPQPTDAEIEFLLTTFSRGLERPLGRSDVLGAYAGLRPLLAAPDGPSEETADLSRRHAVHVTGSVVTVTGGKLTTFRRMASDVIDLLTEAPCRTHLLPLVGAGPLDPAGGGALPDRLVRRFGAEAPAVAALAEDDPGLLRPLHEDAPMLGVEALWAVSAEGAGTLDDVLDGRLRLDLVDSWRAALAPLVAGLVAEHLATPLAPGVPSRL